MRRMDAGGYSACFDHQQLALMCANSDRTIDRLGAENKQLKAENEKLREFAGQVLYFTTMTDGCGDNCPYSSSDCGHECHLREQGRELGVVK